MYHVADFTFTVVLICKWLKVCDTIHNHAVTQLLSCFELASCVEQVLHLAMSWASQPESSPQHNPVAFRLLQSEILRILCLTTFCFGKLEDWEPTWCKWQGFSAPLKWNALYCCEVGGRRFKSCGFASDYQLIKRMVRVIFKVTELCIRECASF